MDRDYVIITPAFNEEEFIESTIISVLQQIEQPKKWIIVDDGSTDRTAEIIQKYCGHDFIKYVFRKKTDKESYYASNVFAIKVGYQAVSNMDFHYLAILDADIIIPKDYYKKLLDNFKKDSGLGVASGVYQNLIKGKLYSVLNDRRSTPKAIQIFKREVFNKIDGYLPLRYGGEDTCSCVMARMCGWKTWSFPEIKTVHLRPTGTGNTRNILKTKINSGLCEYGLGNPFLFVIIKSVKRSLKEKPYIISSLARILGFILGAIKHEKQIIPKDVIKFNKREQLTRLIHMNKIQKDFVFNE